MRLTSPTVQPGQAIPARFTCKGANKSPALRFEDVPDDAKALALVMDDPDAPMGLWTHWTVWDVPPRASTWPEDAPSATFGGVEGTVSNKKVGWHGPCPPSGTHRYFFRAFALDAPLKLPSGAPVDDVRAALKRHTLASAELMATFSA
jgi:hypothetical protein